MWGLCGFCFVLFFNLCKQKEQAYVLVVCGSNQLKARWTQLNHRTRSECLIELHVCIMVMVPPGLPDNSARPGVNNTGPAAVSSMTLFFASFLLEEKRLQMAVEVLSAETDWSSLLNWVQLRQFMPVECLFCVHKSLGRNQSTPL